MRTVVALKRPASATVADDPDASAQGLLSRELIRQAVLIAARDELRLATRDEVIGDTPVTAPGDPMAEVVSDFRVAPGTSRMDLRRRVGAKAETLLKDGRLPDAPDRLGYLPRLAAVAETLSRLEFPAALKALGLQGEPNLFRAEAATPGNVLERLDQFGFVENLTAVRDLHDAIRSDGESPARLGALARGYAQLGVLSEFQWNPAHKAFKARALLYAQRLVSRDPSSPWALWHRAFVETLIGLPTDARADLDEASKQRGAGKAVEPPGWVPALDAYLANDLDRLKDKDGGPHRRLTALLRMMAVEFPNWTTLALHAGRDVLNVDPDCYRAHDVMCEVGGVSNLHVATTLGPQVLSRLLPLKLARLKTLPPAVRKVLDAHQAMEDPSLVEALARAGDFADDPGEPSWGVLAHLVRETQFIQAFRRLHFLRFSLSVPADDEWGQMRPLLASHRNVSFLDALAAPSQSVRHVLARSHWADQLDINDLELMEMPLIGMLAQADPQRAAQSYGLAWSHHDAVTLDLCRGIVLAPPDRVVDRAHTLLDFAPLSSLAMSILIQLDWDSVKDKVPSWEKKAKGSPGLLMGLGARYTEMKRYDEAQKALAEYVRVSPDAWAYQKMAANYKAQGDFVRWKTTLDSFLANVEDTGLDHAAVRVEIAEYYMAQKRWGDARPYAQEAAETWAQWAMQCAVKCYEGLGDLEQAEIWARRVTERYPGSGWSAWYDFCMRTGRGDVKTARAQAEAFLAAQGTHPGIVRAWAAAYFYWSTGSLTKAREFFALAIKENPQNSFLVLHLAMVADEAGDTARRDELFDLLWAKHQGQLPRSNQICRLLREWLAMGSKGAPDLAPVNKVIERVPPNLRGDLEFIVGRFLLHHGQGELARTYLKRCAASPDTDWWLRTLAGPPRAGPDPAKVPPARRVSF